MMIKNLQNRRGWIRIVEAFVAILLVTGVILIVLQQDRINREDISSRAQSSVTAILRDIQLNNSLRQDVIAGSGTIEWDSAGFPVNLKNKIIAKTPAYLECEAKICATNDLCPFTGNQEKNIYAGSVVITSTLQTYSPKQFKLFCWAKE